MANELRSRFDFVAGALDVALAAGETTSTMSSPALADLGVIGTTNHAAISLYTADSNGRITKKEIVHVTAHAAGATTATIARGKEDTTAQAWSIGDKWEHAPTKQDFGGLIGFKSYNPATRASYSPASATFADMDATNLAVPFTFPLSGRIAVQLSAACQGQTNTTLDWNLRDSAGDVAGSAAAIVFNLPNELRQSLVVYLTGTPGVAVTYKWGHARSFGSGTIFTFAGGASNAAVMQVWAVNV